MASREDFQRAAATLRARLRLSVCVGFVLLAGGRRPAAAASLAPRAIGGRTVIDVPGDVAGLADVSKARAGTQVRVQVRADATTLRVIDTRSGTVLGSTALAGYTAIARLAAGYRVFIWGRRATDGALRIWTPALDGSGALVSADPALPCLAGAATPAPVSPIVTLDVAAGWSRPHTTFVDADAARAGMQLHARVVGDAADPAHGVRVDVEPDATAGGPRATIARTTGGRNVASGGFGFAGAVFAYGTTKGAPRLWTPKLTGKSPALVAVSFVACRPDASGFAVSTVDANPQAARAASATIGALGGTLEATGADGTRYALFVPGGALARPTSITVTPAAPTGLELLATAVLGAVDLQPAGLVFAQPARLTVVPPAGTVLDPRGTGGVIWSSGIGARLPTWTITPDGSQAMIDVPHFSGAGLIATSRAAWNWEVMEALNDAPSFAAIAPDLSQLAMSTASTNPSDDLALAERLADLHDGVVMPLVANAAADLPALRLAEEAWARWAALTQVVLPSGQDLAAIALVAHAGTLDGRDATDRAAMLASATALLARFSADAAGGTAACTGTVLGVGDWLTLPLAIGVEVVRLGGAARALPCVRVALDGLTAPADLAGDPRFVDVSFRVVVSAPGQTPGGLALADGRAGFAEAAHLDLSTSDAEFTGVGGTSSTTVEEDLAAGDPFLARLDRGSDAMLRRPTLTIAGVVQGVDLAAAMAAASPGFFDESLPVRIFIGPPTALVIALDPTPASNTVLRPGQTTSLCAQLTDGAGAHPADESVSFAIAGPGSLTTTTATSDASGRACTTYQHPSGPVLHGDTATITAAAGSGSTATSDTITLTPQWAELRLEVTPSATGTAVAATNATVRIAVDDNPKVAVFVSEGGALITDPPQPVAATSIVDFTISSGPGQLSDVPGGGGSTTLLPLTDATGRAEAYYDGGGVGGDATIRVSYPGFNATSAVSATVVLQRATNTLTWSLDNSVDRVCAAGGSDPFTGDDSSEFGTFEVTAVRDGSGGVLVFAAGSVTGSGSHYLVVPFDGGCIEKQLIESWSFSASATAAYTCVDGFLNPALCLDVGGTFTSSRTGTTAYSNTLFFRAAVQTDAQGDPVRFDCNATYSDGARNYVQTGVVDVD